MRGTCSCGREAVKLKKAFDVPLCRKCIKRAPGWCLVYTRLVYQEMVPVKRAVIANLPDAIRGEFVNTCGRGWWEARSTVPLPDADIVAVKRLKAGTFAYYPILLEKP